MRHLIATLVILGAGICTAAGAHAQVNASTTPTEKTLIALEHRMNDALAKGDKATFQTLVAPDAVTADKTGFIPVSKFVEALGQIKITKWKIDNVRVLPVDATSAVVISVWTGEGSFAGRPFDSPVLTSTVWTKKGTRWMAVFHQVTAMATTQ